MFDLTRAWSLVSRAGTIVVRSDVCRGWPAPWSGPHPPHPPPESRSLPGSRAAPPPQQSLRPWEPVSGVPGVTWGPAVPGRARLMRAAEAEAMDEVPGNRWPGSVFISADLATDDSGWPGNAGTSTVLCGDTRA